MQATKEFGTGKPIPAILAGEKSDALGSWLSSGRFALLLAVLVFACFPGVLLGKATFFFRDFASFSYPVAFFHKESFWGGEMPLWNPYNYCGIPFLAQWNTMVLYPFSLIYLILPLTWSLPFFCLAHMWWGGLGMYFLAYRWTNNRLAAGLAGVVFSFNGLMQNFLMWPSHVATFAWVPWVLWLVPDGWRNGRRKLLLAVAVASLQMLAGGPETILFTWILLLLLALGEWLFGSAGTTGSAGALAGTPPFELADLLPKIPASPEGPDLQPSRQGCRRSQCTIPLRFISIVGLVFVLCAAQLLPFLQLLVNSQRDARTASAGFEWSMPVWGWANLLVPMFRTLPHSQGVFFQLQQNWTSSYYATIGAVFFAVLAVFRSRDWRVKVLAGATILALVLALGDGGYLYHGLRTLVPAIGFVRYPVKFTILVLTVLPLLAAVGLRHLLDEYHSKRRFECVWAAALLLFVGAILAVDWKYPVPQDQWHRTWMNGLTRAGFLILVLVFVSVLPRSRGFWRTCCTILVLLVTWFDLATHVPTQNPTARPQIYAAGWTRAHRNDGSAFRLGSSRLMLAPAADEALRYHALPAPEQDVLTKRMAFFSDSNLLDQVPQTYGLFSLAPGPAANLASLPYVHTNLHVPKMLDLMGVTHTTAPGKLYEWVQRPTAMPLVTAGQKPVFADDRAALGALLQDSVDFRKTVFLEKKAHSGISVTSDVPAEVLSSVFEQQRVVIKVKTPASSLVVIAQSYYPAWKAYVDGKQTKVWRANYAFQAVEIPVGTHDILLKYADESFLAGVLLSCAGLIACLGIWILCRD